MKILSTVLLFLFIQHCSYAQSDYGYNNDKALIRKNKVSALSVYYYNTETDSLLTERHTYDTSGNQLLSLMVGKNGEVYRKDSFVYDLAGHLLRRYSADGTKDFMITRNYYDDRGRFAGSELEGDSMHYHQQIILYDEAGRIKKMAGYDEKGDTTIFENFYNRQGLLEQSVISNRQQGTTTHRTFYNAAGKAIRTSIISKGSTHLFEYKYNKAGMLYESNSKLVAGDRTTLNRLLYSYYTNGLSFEKIWFINRRPSMVNRVYYSYF